MPEEALPDPTLIRVYKIALSKNWLSKTPPESFSDDQALFFYETPWAALTPHVLCALGEVFPEFAQTPPDLTLTSLPNWAVDIFLRFTVSNQ